jgi:hypothetical protein
MRVNDTNRSLLQFDVSGIPNGATVTNAELVLCFSSILSLAVGRTHELNRPSSSWIETAVTWNNQPGGNSGQAITWNIPLITGCISLDVKAPVQDWVTNGNNDGWRISDQNESSALLADVEYHTREGSVSGLRPTLNITYSPP